MYWMTDVHWVREPRHKEAEAVALLKTITCFLLIKLKKNKNRDN